MLYIAIEDQFLQTEDALLEKVWAERRQLRLDLFDLQKKIKELDAFIDTYIRCAGITELLPKQNQFGIHLPLKEAQNAADSRS